MVPCVSIIILILFLKVCVCVCLIEGSIKHFRWSFVGLWRFFLSSFYFPVCSKCCTININLEKWGENHRREQAQRPGKREWQIWVDVCAVRDSESLSLVTEAWSFCYQGSPLWGLPVFFLFGVLFLFQKVLLKCS